MKQKTECLFRQVLLGFRKKAENVKKIFLHSTFIGEVHAAEMKVTLLQMC